MAEFGHGMKRKKTITIEIERLKITSTGHQKRLAWCAICQAEGEFLDRAEAACLAGIARSQGWALSGSEPHFYQPAVGEVLVCLTSILGRKG